jgi:hypothetical protein
MAMWLIMTFFEMFKGQRSKALRGCFGTANPSPNDNIGQMNKADHKVGYISYFQTKIIM